MINYYIATKGNWQGQTWEPLDEPLPKEQAEKLAKSVERHGDLKSEIYAKVVNRTWLSKNGYPYTDKGTECLQLEIMYANMKIEDENE